MFGISQKKSSISVRNKQTFSVIVFNCWRPKLNKYTTEKLVFKY